MRFLLLLVTPLLLAAQPSIALVEKVAGKVGFYDSTGRRIAEVKVGTYPHEIVPSLDGRTLYVSNNGILWMENPGEGGNTIAIIDRQTRAKLGDIDLGNNHRPHGMAVQPTTGLLVMTTENPHGLVLVDPVAKKVLRRFDVHGEGPHMVLFDRTGEWAFVSNATTNNVAAIRLATGETIVIPTGKRPQGGVLSPDGRTIFITNSNENTISLIDPAQRKVIGEIKTGDGPNRVTITPDGKTLVYSLSRANAAAFADVATRKELRQIPLGSRPLSLVMSRDGRWAFSGIQDKDLVRVIDVAQRQIVKTIDTPKDAGPDSVFPLE